MRTELELANELRARESIVWIISVSGGCGSDLD